MIFWLRIAAVAFAAGSIFGAGWYVRGLVADREQQAALADLAQKMADLCQQDKALTEDTNETYRKKLAAADARLRELNRVRPARCIVPASGATSGGAGSNTTGLNAGQDGVTAQALYAFAGDCERLRLQGASMQEFMERVWVERQ